MLYDLRREKKLERAKLKVERAYAMTEQLDRVIGIIRSGWCKGAYAALSCLENGHHDALHCWVGAIQELPVPGRARLYAAIARHLPAGFRRPAETPRNALIRFNDDVAASGQELILIMWQARMAAAQIAGRLD